MGNIFALSSQYFFDKMYLSKVHKYVCTQQSGLLYPGRIQYSTASMTQKASKRNGTTDGYAPSSCSREFKASVLYYITIGPIYNKVLLYWCLEITHSKYQLMQNCTICERRNQ